MEGIIIIFLINITFPVSIYGSEKSTSFLSGVVVIPDIIMSIFPVFKAPSRLSNAYSLFLTLNDYLWQFFANSISTPAYSVYHFSFSNSNGA